MLQSCPTLCDPIDGSPPGSAIPGILQARTLEWAAISFSNSWKRKVKVKSLSRVQLLATPWTAAYQAPPSMDFPGKSAGAGCPCLLRQSGHVSPNMSGTSMPLSCRSCSSSLQEVKPSAVLFPRLNATPPIPSVHNANSSFAELHNSLPCLNSSVL